MGPYCRQSYTWNSMASSWPLPHNIVQMDYAVRKFLGRKQFEWNGPVLGLNQWYAGTDEDRNHMDAELVDLSFVQKRSNDLATSHHPNILTGLRPQLLHEWFDRLVSPHEFI